MSFSTEARVIHQNAVIEVRNYVWNDPLDDVVVDEHPVFGLSLSPVPRESQAFFGDLDDNCVFNAIGKMLFRPAAMPMRFTNAGGKQRLVMCTVPAHGDGSTCGDLFELLSDARPIADLRHDGLAFTLRRLAQEACEPGFASSAMVEALVTGLLVDFIRMEKRVSAERKPNTGGLAPWQLRRIDEALHHIDGSAPGVSDLATIIGVSPRHLLRAFRASTGITVVKHIARVRANRACELLLSTRLPVKQIASRCGYASTTAFATAFRREIGLPPKEYRARTRQ